MNKTYPISRRSFLKTGSATLGGLALSGLAAPALAQDNDEITVMLAQPNADAAEILKAKFKEKTGVKVNTVIVPFSQVYQQAALDQQSGANRFDVIQNWYCTIGALASNGLVRDVTDLIDRDAAEVEPTDFISSLYDPYTKYNGRRYALPFDGDAHALYYNLEIFERLGVKPPKTWDELNTLTEHLTNELKGEGIYGHALIGMAVPVLNISTFTNRVANYGGAYLTADGKPDLMSDQVLAAAANMAAVAPHCSPTPVEIGYTEGLNLFLSGKAAMTEGWTDLGINANLDADSMLKDGWGMVRLPTASGNPADARAGLNAGWSISVSNATEKEELAWEFVKFASGHQMAKHLLTTNGTAVDPYRTSAMNSDAYRERVGPVAHEVISHTFQNAMAWPTVPDAPQMLEILSAEVGSMLAQQKTAEEAMSQAQRAWDRLIG